MDDYGFREEFTFQMTLNYAMQFWKFTINPRHRDTRDQNECILICCEATSGLECGRMLYDTPTSAGAVTGQRLRISRDKASSSRYPSHNIDGWISPWTLLWIYQSVFVGAGNTDT